MLPCCFWQLWRLIGDTAGEDCQDLVLQATKIIRCGKNVQWLKMISIQVGTLPGARFVDEDLCLPVNLHPCTLQIVMICG